PLLLERIGQLVNAAQLYRDLECDQPPRAEQLPQFLKRIDGYLCEIKEAQIRDGLHVLGRLPEGGQLIDLLLALVRVDNGDVPGMVKALAHDLGLDYQALTRDPAAPAPSLCLSMDISFPNSVWERCLGNSVSRVSQAAKQSFAPERPQTEFGNEKHRENSPA